MSVRAINRPLDLPIEVSGEHSTGWWGMLMLIATEASIFAYLLFSYYYLHASNPVWPPTGMKRPDLTLPIPMTIILLSSSIPMWWADRHAKQGHMGRVMLGLAVSFLMGATFLGMQGVEYSNKDYGPQVNAYGALFYFITGLHGTHVFIGLIMNALMQLRTWLGHFSAERHQAIENVALYWHFVDAVWVFIFSSLYVFPHFT